MFKLINFFVKKFVNERTGRLSGGPNTENALDISKAKVKGLRFFDEFHFLKRFRAVVAIIIGRTIGGFDQVQTFVVAQGADGEMRSFGKFSDFEKWRCRGHSEGFQGLILYRINPTAS